MYCNFSHIIIKQCICTFKFISSNYYYLTRKWAKIVLERVKQVVKYVFSVHGHFNFNNLMILK